MPTLEEFSQLLRIPILNQLPFNDTERDPKPEEIAQALHLQPSDITTNWDQDSKFAKLGFCGKSQLNFDQA